MALFDLALFDEVAKSDNTFAFIEANVIDRCIEVIIGLPDIRKQRKVHRIPSYFDTLDPTFLIEAKYSPKNTEESTPAVLHVAQLIQPTSDITSLRTPSYTCAPYIGMGYNNTMCSATGRPYIPQEM